MADQMSTGATEGELGILARRKIEAAIIAPIYAEMCAQLGEEKAQGILDKAIRAPRSVRPDPSRPGRPAAPASAASRTSSTSGRRMMP